MPRFPWPESSLLIRARTLLLQEGVPIFLVGGAVRDALLGRPTHDYDFAVDGLAMDLARKMANALGGAYVPLDEERDTARAVVRDEAGQRLYLDFARLRGPDIQADLTGRDFTINAIAVDLRTGQVLDPLDGQADLSKKLVRATTPHTFREDPVRLLRAVRMVADLGFELDPSTARQAQQDAPLLAQSSAERVRDELARILDAPGSPHHLALMDRLGTLSIVLPEIALLRGEPQTPPHHWDVWEHTLYTLGALERLLQQLGMAETLPRPETAPPVPEGTWQEIEERLIPLAPHLQTHLAQETGGEERTRLLLLKLGTLFHDVGKPATHSMDDQGRIHFYGHDAIGAEMAAGRLQLLRFNRREVQEVERMVAHHMRPAYLARSGRPSRRAVYRYFRALGPAGVEVALLALADHLAIWGPDLIPERWTRLLEVVEQLLARWFQDHDQVHPPPLISGHDLIETLGVPPGPRVGRILEAVREAQAAGEVHNREEALALAAQLAHRG